MDWGIGPILARRAATPILSWMFREFAWSAFRWTGTFADSTFILSTMATWGVFLSFFGMLGRRDGLAASTAYALWLVFIGQHEPLAFGQTLREAWLPSDLTQPLFFVAIAWALRDRRFALCAMAIVLSTVNRETGVVFVVGLAWLGAYAYGAVASVGWAAIKYGVLHAAFPGGGSALHLWHSNVEYLIARPVSLVLFVGAIGFFVYAASFRQWRPVALSALAGIAVMFNAAIISETRAFAEFGAVAAAIWPMVAPKK